MSHTLQIFVYSDEDFDYGIVTHANNFPLIRFESKQLAYDFVSELKSQPMHKMEEPYFVINNAQLLPDGIRRQHMFREPSNDDDSDSDIESDEAGNRYMLRDGCFSMRENIHVFASCVIDDNTNEQFGFNKFLELYNAMLNECAADYYQSDEYYNSAEYLDDLREDYNDRRKYDFQDDRD
jgi:hypothetical protein